MSGNRAASDQTEEARCHRARLSGVVVVAVTGSCGKTTTKDLIASLLATRYRGSKSSGSYNCGTDIARDLLAVHPDDRFFVQELGAWGPGTLDAGIDLIHPHIAVVTNLRNDHYSAFGGPRGAQAEKGKLVACLPGTGTAVLNWDDEYVRELAGRTSAPILRVGRNPQADLHAVDITSRWPAPLSFRAVCGREQVPVRTRLLGEHLLGSALAALAVGIIFGMTLTQAAAALEAAEPTPRRMTPVAHPDGITFIRDDFKAPSDSIPEVLAFMRDATATRKLAVLGRISDYPGRSRPTYTDVAGQAIASLDAVVFVGQRAAELWGKQHSGSAADQHRLRQQLGLNRHGAAHRPADMYVFETVARASRFLSGYLRADDLVLLKGSGPTDHLERILLSRQQPVSCWLRHCGRMTSCDACELLAAGCWEARSAAHSDAPSRREKTKSLSSVTGDSQRRGTEGGSRER
jgi:UDP-N-acetylmuramoyl-tripeptide--D-alanyl-D-alanine ligase